MRAILLTMKLTSKTRKITRYYNHTFFPDSLRATMRTAATTMCIRLTKKINFPRFIRAIVTRFYCYSVVERNGRRYGGRGKKSKNIVGTKRLGCVVLDPHGPLATSRVLDIPLSRGDPLLAGILARSNTNLDKIFTRWW